MGEGVAADNRCHLVHQPFVPGRSSDASEDFDNERIAAAAIAAGNCDRTEGRFQHYH